MRYYLDTSAVIRAIDASEPGSSYADQLLLNPEHSFIWAHFLPAELASGLARKCREGRLSTADRDRAFQVALGRLEPRSLVVSVEETTVDLAVELLFRHTLRAYDALHLATALEIRDIHGGDLTFCTSDADQARAATAEGFALALLS